MDVCDFEECGRRRYLRGWCRSHYQHYLDGRELKPIRAQRADHAPAERDSKGRKFCTRCELWLPERMYSKRKTSSDKLATYCKACHSAYARETRYNIDAADIAKMLHNQDGQCITCDALLGDGYNIDHDHSCCPGYKSCGKCVRGLLCRDCNTLIGQLERNPDRVSRMLSYIRFKGK